MRCPFEKFILSFLFCAIAVGLSAQEQEALYPLLNQKSWSRVLQENNYKWRPPYTLNLLLHPVHSPDWVYLNPSMTVSRRSVPENVTTTDRPRRKAAESQEDLVVQFAFDEPAFIPDFRLVNLKLDENKYPLATADYFANDIYYEIEYAAAALGEEQTILSINVVAKNEGDRERKVHVRTKIGYYPENEIFDYHYIPFSWTSAKWMPYDHVSMAEGEIYKDGNIIGVVGSERMEIGWEDSKSFTDKEYEAVLYPQVWYGSGYALPDFRARECDNVIHASQTLSPGDSTSFSIKLLVNDGSVSPADIERLHEMTATEIKETAKRDFKEQLTGDVLSVDFAACQYGDILTELQLCILQLLVKHQDSEFLQPAQGGSSERFYVWVFEAVNMLLPMLRTGQFDAVRRSLDFIFSLQDAGVPPVGRFTTTEGAVGTTGPRWASTTGIALVLACEYFLYSGDEESIEEYLPKILKAMHWISGEVKATRKLNPDGSRPATYGIMPYAVASDGDRGFFLSNDIFSYWGFSKSVQLLEKLDHPEAAEMRGELERYREDLLVAINYLAQPNGYIDRRIATEDMVEATKFVNTDIMAPIATVGIISPFDDIFQRYINYYEYNVASDFFMGQMDRDIYYIIQCERFWQPIYLTLGEWKKAFMTLQTCLKYGMSQDTHQTAERFSKRDPSFVPWQPNGSGSGGVIDMILNTIYFENSREEVTLLGGVPFEYLVENGHTKVENLHTLTGKVSLEIFAKEDGSCTLSLSSDNPLPKKIRFPKYILAVPENSDVKDLSGGYFETAGGVKNVSFTLSGVE